MAVYKRFSPNILSAFSIVMMIAVWITFAPTQVGGMASYIIVIGNSMEPKFHIGDLVVVHKEPIYRVGDAIVYRNLELKNFVFHRIISQEMGHYTLQGDNNSWMDTYRPSRAEVIGKLWLHVPRGGAAVQKIRTPFVMALLAGALGAILATSLFVNKAKGNKHMNNKLVQEWFTSIKQMNRNWLTKINTPEPQKPLPLSQGEILEGSFFVLGLVALASLILGIIVFSRPAARIAHDDISYQHLGIFSYSASTPQGVYDANTIKSGDPIFTKLTCSLDANFQYTLIAGQAENIMGTYQLTAILSEQVSGWQRVVPLQEETAFSGATFGTTARLDLCEIKSLTQSMEQEADFHPGSYTLVITPRIKVNGNISGRTLESAFDPALTFRYDHIQFYLAENEGTNDPFAVTETGILRKEHKEANTLLLFNREIAIPALRGITIFGLIGSLGGLLMLGLRLQNLSRLDQAKFFRIRYASLMIDVQNTDAIPLSNLIDATSMDTLAKLAERSNAVILHVEQNNLHTYYVQHNGTTYRFTVVPGKVESGMLESETSVHKGAA